MDATIVFSPVTNNTAGAAVGKLADAEVHFGDRSLFAGLKLVGFSVWENRNAVRRVVVPSRQYAVNGERRSFALIQPATDATSRERLEAFILERYQAFEAAQG